MTSPEMTSLAIRPVLTALAVRLTALPDLTAFTLVDRAPTRRTVPALRLGPVSQDPWDTGSSHGARLDVTITLSSRTGSLTQTLTAAESIAADMAGAPLALSAGHVVDQTVHSIRVEHRAGSDLETATMTATLHIDLGDTP